MVDSDTTYPAEAAKGLMGPIVVRNADMVIRNRLALSLSALPWFHLLGTRVMRWFVNFVFGTRFSDILSEYRVMSRRVLREIPLLTPGFEIETELTIQVLERGRVIRKIEAR